MPWEKAFDEKTGNSRIFAFGVVSVPSAGVLTAEQKFFGSAEAIPSWEFFGKIFLYFWGVVLFDSLYFFTAGMLLP